ncbi:hypothetical protein [Actinoplanes sp. DH11]|uniref:hypothetical protein n=1 Tax=Actinoplanes sp. DH11 TaxID=2857011 RepID=UPI001E2DAB00|nr:hypothetical protein [Actinoplanes sp. DH11]
MKPRLSRPLLAAVVGGAVLAGGTVLAPPAQAAPVGGGADNGYRTTAPAEAPDVPAQATGTDPAPAAAATTPPAAAAVPPVTVPDTEKPKGSFRLSATSLWIGQKVTLGQNANEYSDNVDPDAYLTRKISWGDGTTTTLAANATFATKQYARTGRFTVTETITDRSGNSFTTAGRAVTLTSPGKFSLSRYTVYQGAPFTVNFAGIPAGTTKIRLDWGDGWLSDHAASEKSVRGLILYRKNTSSKISGKVTLRAQLFNKYGPTSWLKVGTTNVLKDKWKPKLTITKPKNPNRISSWKTVRGTISDKGAGVRFVGVTVVRVTTSGKYYCLTPKKKWKRYTTEEQLFKYCETGKNAAKVSKGKWSLKVPAGITKGRIVVLPWAYDRADNYADTYRGFKITRK